LEEAKKALPDTSVAAVIGGPWTIAIGLRGANELIRDAIKDPDYVHELMDFCSQMSLRFGEAVTPLRVGLSYSEAPASCSLISPKIYRTFIFPHHKRIVDHFKAKQVGVGLHVCGYADPILEDLVNTGVTNLSVDAPTDLAKAVEVTKGKAVLIGNVNTNLFFSGSKEEMKEAIRSCLDIAGTGSGYILASGCEVPGVAPPEKVDWFMEHARALAKWN
jgi:uroporphyrinogen decarboxylase